MSSKPYETSDIKNKAFCSIQQACYWNVTKTSSCETNYISLTSQSLKFQLQNAQDLVRHLTFK